jgi:hypothetical protein
MGYIGLSLKQGTGNPGIGESDKNFIGFNLIYSIYNLCSKRK